MRPRITLIMLALLLCVGCSSAADRGAPPAPTCPPCPTQAPNPTYTPYPTLAPLPTYTPYPTFTPIPKPTEPPTVTPAPTSSAGTRSKPLALGETATVSYLGGEIELTVREIVSGEEATKRVLAANMFNDQPADGYEYVLIYVIAKIKESPDDKALSLSEHAFKQVDAEGQIWAVGIAVVKPDPEFSGKGYAGATIEGWSLVMRKTGEPFHYVFDLDNDGSGGVWWAIPGGD